MAPPPPPGHLSLARGLQERFGAGRAPRAPRHGRHLRRGQQAPPGGRGRRERPLPFGKRPRLLRTRLRPLGHVLAPGQPRAPPLPQPGRLPQTLGWCLRGRDPPRGHGQRPLPGV